MKITSDAWRLMEKFIRGEYVGPELHREARSDAVLRATDPEHWRVLIPETPSELINEENFTYSLPLDLPAPPRLRMRE